MVSNYCKQIQNRSQKVHEAKSLILHKFVLNPSNQITTIQVNVTDNCKL